MLIIKSPYPNLPEISYTCDVVFRVFLGLPYRIEESMDNSFHVVMDKKSVQMSAAFFSTYETQGKVTAGAKLQNLDSRPFGDIKLVDYQLPVIFGQPQYQASKTAIQIGFDILGTVFFMLSRYEEIGSKSLDNHERFPASESLAYKYGFLDRPIVDEYVEVLWHALHSLWPDLRRKNHVPRIKATCDVDAPYEEAVQNVYRLCRANAVDLIKNKTTVNIKRRAKNYLATRKGNYTYDQCDTFEWFMDTCEKANTQASFYFIPDHSAGRIDGYYDIFEPRIINLIQTMSRRGHALGVHSSYNSYQSSAQLKHERERMIEVCNKANVTQTIIGNRQHYLRWDSSQTPRHLQAAGYEYDTSGSFADKAGFRYGTSLPFPMWDWVDKKPLSLFQVPLILMECSVIADRYMGLGYSEEALKVMQKFKHRSLAYGGTFTLLWHNNHFTTAKDREFFTELVS